MASAQVIRIHKTGGFDALQLDEITLPARRDGDVRVRVHAAGLNFLDTQLRSGLYARHLPLAMGAEGSGLVEEAAHDSTFKIGDRVAWAGVQGSYATRLDVPAAKLVALPDSISLEQAAACLFQGLTAHYLAHSTYALKPGDTCVIQSAAGGVGLLLTRMAKIRGARIIGTVSSDAKAAAVGDAGADLVINYTTENLPSRVKEFTGGRGADVVYDAVGKDTFERSLTSLRPRGLLALYGEASGEIPPIDVRVLGNAGSVYLTRTGLGAYIADPDEHKQRTDDLIGWISDGRLSQPITTFPLREAAAAHAALESRKVIGKVLLLA